MLGPAGCADLPQRHRRPRRGNEPPGRRGPVSPLSPLGCDSDSTTGGPPRQGRPAALGPTRSRVARHGRTCDSDDSERAGGEEGGCSESYHLPSQNVSGQRAHYLPPPSPNAADVKESSIEAGFIPAAAKGQPICNKGVVLSRPTATRSGARAPIDPEDYFRSLNPSVNFFLKIIFLFCCWV